MAGTALGCLLLVRIRQEAAIGPLGSALKSCGRSYHPDLALAGGDCFCLEDLVGEEEAGVRVGGDGAEQDSAAGHLHSCHAPVVEEQVRALMRGLSRVRVERIPMGGPCYAHNVVDSFKDQNLNWAGTRVQESHKKSASNKMVKWSLRLLCLSSSDKSTLGRPAVMGRLTSQS